MELDREVRRLHGRTTLAWEVTTPAFRERLARTLDGSQGLAHISLPRWNVRRQIDGNVMIARLIAWRNVLRRC